jgi:hypothetical protein
VWVIEISQAEKFTALTGDFAGLPRLVRPGEGRP